MRVIFFSSWLGWQELMEVEMLSAGILDMTIRISLFRRFEFGVLLVGRLQVSLTSITVEGRIDVLRGEILQ
jgi:hypothetical protein